MSGAFSQRLQDSILKERNSFDWIKFQVEKKGGASTFKPAFYLEEGGESKLLSKEKKETRILC